MQENMSGFDPKTGTSVVLEPGMKLEDILGPVAQRQSYKPATVNGQPAGDDATVAVGSKVDEVLGPESQWQRHRPATAQMAAGNGKAPVMPGQQSTGTASAPRRPGFSAGLGK